MGEARGRLASWAQERLWSVYSRYYDGLLDLVPYRRLVEQVVRAVDAPDGATVVDLGCGTGNTIDALLADAADLRVTGVDSSADMLGVARRKLSSSSVELHRRDLLEWLREAPSDSFDRVISVNVLYTMHAEDRAVFWRESMRIMGPGGRLVLVTTDREGVGPVIREHFQERTVRSSFSFRLLAVLGLNMVIWAMEARRLFDPASAATLAQECTDAGGSVVTVQRCYGGEQDGVDVLMVVEPVVDLAEVERTASASAGGVAEDDPVLRADEAVVDERAR